MSHDTRPKNFQAKPINFLINTRAFLIWCPAIGHCFENQNDPQGLLGFLRKQKAKKGIKWGVNGVNIFIFSHLGGDFVFTWNTLGPVEHRRIRPEFREFLAKFQARKGDQPNDLPTASCNKINFKQVKPLRNLSFFLD